MFKIPLPEIKAKILESGKITADALELKIKNKINELSGLISEEGAAHIIANEFGVDLVVQGDKLKIKQVYAGMRDISTLGKVVRKFDIREFAKEDRTGKVCSIVLGDETGTIRVVFWNDQVDLLKNVNEEDILEIKHGYVRENNNAKEVHLGDRGEIVINPAGQKIDSVREGPSHERKKIQELEDGQGAELMATIVKVFDPRFWNTCPRCNKKVLQMENGFQCTEHGEIQASLSYVLNLILDDGTSTIRAVFWKNQVNHLLGKKEEEMVVFKDDPSQFEEVKTDLLGEQLKVLGNSKRNEMFDRLEFSVQVVEKANPDEEVKKLEKS
ncbi:MAG: OB-fold nucleic acid binding domain-containing protein [Candidatus Woesearchaeota archaeon]